MTVRERILAWRPRRRAGTPEGMVPAAKIASTARNEAAEQVSAADRELVAQHERLTERFALMQAELGGVFYEMAIRDHVRMDVLTRKAAELQRVDAELAEVERALRGEDAGPATGICPDCAARHGAGAHFCSRCGHALGTTTNGSSP